MGDHSKDDDFLDAKLFALNVKVSREYKDMVDYLLHHKFLDKANKQLKGRIALKARPYAIFGVTFTIKEKMGFCGGLLKRRMFQHFFLSSMKTFVEVILLEGLPQKKSYEEGIIG